MADNKDKKVLKSSIEREQSQTCLNSAEREKIKGSTNLNVPHLRFPEFSGEWEEHTIGELATKVGSGVTPKGGETVYKKEGHPFVRSQNVGLGVLLLEDIAYIDDTTHIRQKNTELQIDDVLLNITGASIGRSAVVNEQIAGGNVNQHVCIIRTKDNLVSSFLCNFLLSNYGQKQIDSFQAGGNRQGLNFEQIKSIKIGIPCVKEQSKIAKTLQLLDERIATQNKIIEKLESLIKGLNDSLYERYGDGIRTSFAELGYSYSGLSGKSAGDFGTGKPFITYLNVYSNNVVNENDYQYVQIDEGEKQNVVQYGDVLFTLSSETPEEVGIGSVYLGQDEVYLNSFCFGVHIVNEELAYPPYISYYVSSTPFRKFIYPFAQGSTRFNLCKADFEKASITLPSLDNQKRIHSVLNSITMKINTERAMLEQYVTQKQHLLRQMFI